MIYISVKGCGRLVKNYYAGKRFTDVRGPRWIRRWIANDVIVKVTDFESFQGTQLNPDLVVAAQLYEDIQALYQSWLVNTVFSWIGMVVTGVITTLIVKCLIQRGRVDVERLQRFLIRRYGWRAMARYGIATRKPGDPCPDPDYFLYSAERGENNNRYGFDEVDEPWLDHPNTSNPLLTHPQPPPRTSSNSEHATRKHHLVSKYRSSTRTILITI